MKHISTLALLIFLITTLISCGAGEQKENTSAKVAFIDTLQQKNLDLKETFNVEDEAVNEYLSARLKPISDNFKRINSIPLSEWSSVFKKKTSEGEVNFYHYNQELDKITVRNFKDSIQRLTEYYLINGQLSLVFARSRDTRSTELREDETIEEKSYFENGKLIHQANNQDCGSPFSESYLLEEQKRITSEYNRLVQLGKSK